MKRIEPKLIVTFGNPGGDGKTTIATAIEAICKALSLSAEVVCGDAGNGSIRQILPSAASVAWGAAPQIGGDIIAAYRSNDVQIIDCGANSSTAAYNILDLLVEARSEADKQGRKSIALLPIGTNKPGSVGMAKSSEGAFRQAGYQTHIILNNRDGSGSYLGLDPDDGPFPEVPHLSPGFVSVLHLKPGTWYNLIVEPPSGFEIAVDFIADWLQRISALQPIRDALGLQNGGYNFGRRSPLKLRSSVADLRFASDRALLANHQYAIMMERLLTDQASSADVREALEQFDLALAS